jgi:peptide/nickel transport system substrate-binding protein
MDRWRSGKFQLLSFGFSAKADPSLSYEFILGDRTKSPSKTWDDPAALALLSASALTTDAAQRREIFERLHAFMIRDVPYVALFSPADINAVRDGVSGFRPWQFGRARFWSVARVGSPRA